jgi:hypothetical protein
MELLVLLAYKALRAYKVPPDPKVPLAPQVFKALLE